MKDTGLLRLRSPDFRPPASTLHIPAQWSNQRHRAVCGWFGERPDWPRVFLGRGADQTDFYPSPSLQSDRRPRSVTVPGESTVNHIHQAGKAEGVPAKTLKTKHKPLGNAPAIKLLPQAGRATCLKYGNSQIAKQLRFDKESDKSLHVTGESCPHPPN